MTSDVTSTGSPTQYRLSALLSGHSDDVRGLACDNTSRLFSTSRDGTARSWTRHGPREGTTGGWEQERLFEGFHTGFVNSVAWLGQESLAAAEGSEHGFLLTGGQDSLIQVYDLAQPSGTAPAHTLIGHNANVCALHAVGTTVMGLYRTRMEYEKLGVWDVLAVGTSGHEGCAITACADSLIRLFKPASEAAAVVFKGHTEPVRALAKVLPEDKDCVLFASCSNDGSIRIWDFSGNAITSLDGHDSFIYALVSIPKLSGGGMASSGEDGIVKIWDEDEGEEEQEILVPALSVWALTSLPNGDLAIACSDNLIWVFTRDAARTANAATITDYETRLASRPKPAAKAPPAPSLPVVDSAELATPGSKEGEVKLVDVSGTTHAYQWTAGNWVDLGEVTDGPGEVAPTEAEKGKMMHEGKAYDYVVDIDIADDQPALKLPFNLEDNPQEVVDAFVAEHKLPETYRERLLAFVAQFQPK
ncbi:hypothetical protein RQP46_000981 [Phenoliferia psychrophenolica]